MMKPTIHLNGTNAQDLCDGYMEALEAVRVAHARLAATAPHGRDYYVQSPGAIQTAITEHTRRLALLELVQEDLNQLMIHCMAEVLRPITEGRSK